VGVRVVLASPVMAVLRCGLMRGQLLQPHIVVVEQSVLSVIYVYARGGVRCLFATALLLPPDHCIHTAGNALRPIQER
jgi:hypothetical protein